MKYYKRESSTVEAIHYFKYDGKDLYIFDNKRQWRVVDKLFTEMFKENKLSSMYEITEQEAFLEIL